MQSKSDEVTQNWIVNKSLISILPYLFIFFSQGKKKKIQKKNKFSKKKEKQKLNLKNQKLNLKNLSKDIEDTRFSFMP